MKMPYAILIAISLPFLLSSCASNHTRFSDRNQFVTELYASVDQIYDVEFESHVGEAAATWGLWGALENASGSDRQIIAGALVGAFFGGLLMAIEEGPSQGYEYHLTATDGEYLVVVLDYYPADEGDCVRIRMASQVKLYSTDPEFCRNSNL